MRTLLPIGVTPSAGRRWPAALLILAAVLIAAVLTRQAAGTKVAGTAQIGELVAGVPAVGDCLLQPVRAADAAVNSRLQYPPVSTGPCRDRRYGEVVAVIDSANVKEGTVSLAGTNDPNIVACINAVARYLGGPARLALGGGWQPVAATSTLAAGPTPQQRAAKQNWIACIQYIDPDGPRRFHSDDYRRTATLAFSTNSPPPAAFSTCLHTTASIDPDIVDCHRPHPAELFARASGTATISRLVLANSCALLVSQYTGIPATSSEQLTVEVNVYGQNGQLVPDNEHTISDYTAMCIVVPAAGGQLTGPLMDIRDRALPLR